MAVLFYASEPAVKPDRSNTMKAILISLFVLCSAVFAADTTVQNPHKIHGVSDDAVWLDVRSAEEFAAGHLPGAVNIPHTEVATRIAELKLDKATPIAIYCKSGRRAGIALEALQQLGYSDLSNQGGFDDLQQQLNSDNER
jgi:phage shock protein E